MNIQFWQLIDWARQLSPIWIPVTYAITLLIISPLHSVFNEWSGVMQYFSGKEILRGDGYRGWTSHFWPPLFSTVLGLVSKLLPGSTAGKIISIMSGFCRLPSRNCINGEQGDWAIDPVVPGAQSAPFQRVVAG
jgi:hypothetical protein